MTHHQTIALIGGTGKAGRHVLQQLLAQNFHVKLLTRRPENISDHSPLVQKIKGDARYPEAIDKLLSGCDAVISCLGQPAGEAPIFSDATRNILTAMSTSNIRRYIVLAGLNVDTPSDNKGETTLAGTNYMKQHYPGITADRQAEYKLLAKSAADWTLVRIPLLLENDITAKLAIDITDCPGNQINANDLAMFVIAQIDDGTYIRSAPFVASI